MAQGQTYHHIELSIFCKPLPILVHLGPSLIWVNFSAASYRVCTTTKLHQVLQNVTFGLPKYYCVSGTEIYTFMSAKFACETRHPEYGIASSVVGCVSLARIQTIR